MVKRVIKKCVVCRKVEGVPFKAQPQPDLPPARVSDDPPFTNVGLDFAGPMYVRREERDQSSHDHSSKVYVLLLTCASTRAVHLELTQSLSVPSFLRAFRRFVSRRGLPSLLMSDNAKTFKAACKEIRKLSRAQEVWRYLSNNRITWRFITERAPWWGGFWERLVRSIKRPLKKVGRTSLTYDELNTLLVEVEGLINARPITYVFDDQESISYPLSPSHLIYGRRITTEPNSEHYEVISTYQSLMRKAQHHRNLLLQFTKRWRTEYLLSLREQSMVKSKSNKAIEVAVGDIVLLKNDKTSRNFWKLAKIEQLLYGDGGVARAVIVKVVGGKGNRRTQLLRRSIQQLVPIEVKQEIREANEPLNDKVVVPVTARPRRNAAIVGELRRQEQM